MEDHTGPLLDLSHAGPDIISIVLSSMSLRDRCNCALVCKAWAEAATAATHSIILDHVVQDLSSLKHWLERHGNMIEVLQLHAGYKAALDALPCCAKLQDLLLHHGSIASRTWGDIASATKLTSISLSYVQTVSHQADVVAALTALPNLEQLTWQYVQCSNEQLLLDSSLLQHLTQLTSVELRRVKAAALQHLGSLTKLQHLSISGADDWGAAADDWAAAGCPWLQELTALTRLKLVNRDMDDLSTSISQLTALRQLEVRRVTLTQLQVLTALTRLCVTRVIGLSPASPPLQLAGLQHLDLFDIAEFEYATMPMTFLASCTQLQFLKLLCFNLKGPGSLVASTMLQHLELRACSISAAAGAAGPASWQQVFPGPGQLPHLTALQLTPDGPVELHQADIEAMVACCSNLKVLCCNTLPSSCMPALARLPCLTSLRLPRDIDDEECSALVQLTGLRQLMVDPCRVSAVGLRHLAALRQLTSLGFGYCSDAVLGTVAEHLMKDNLPDCSHALINKVCGKKGILFWCCVCVC